MSTKLSFEEKELSSSVKVSSFYGYSIEDVLNASTTEVLSSPD